MMKLLRFSVIIPARNEELFIGACLESIRAAGTAYEGQVEVIVVLNRCSDRTEEIARSFGAHTVREDARNLARIRNAGARAAQGQIFVTIDADSAMSPDALVAIDRALSSGTTVGGGTPISWYDWATKIFAAAGLEPRLKPTNEREFRTAARRPKYSALSNSKMESLGIAPMPPLDQAIADYLKARAQKLS